MSEPISTYTHQRIDSSLEFLKRTRWELRELRKVRVFADHLHIIDINGDFFELRGVGYPDADIIPILRAINTAFDPQIVHATVPIDFKEFLTGRRHTWAHDRVM